jgi:hypothetical protein
MKRATEVANTIDPSRRGKLGGLPAEFAAQTLPGGSLFGALFLAWFQIKGMLLNFFDDVFLLDFALESLQRTFQGFTILNHYFSQTGIHLLLKRTWILS